MNASTEMLIIGVAGIVATLLSSGMGLYFTARARRSPMRELLYARQLELIIRVLRIVGRIRVFIAILVSEDDQFKERARVDIGVAVKRLSQLSNDAAALLPTELFGEVQRLSSLAVDVLVKLDASETAAALSSQLDAQSAKTALMARALLGVDELSEESMALFAKHGSLDRLSRTGLHQFRRRGPRAKDRRRAV